MNLADVIEVPDRTPQRRRFYLVVLLLAFAMLIVFRGAEHAGWMGHPAPHSDFDVFYAGSELVRQGRIIEAYDYARFAKAQVEILGADNRVAWSYPPPYNLVVAPLATMSLALAFTLFIAMTAAAYLWTLLRLAGDHAVTALLLNFLSLYGVVIFGQNGMLTGTLVGLACLGLLRGRGRRDALAGLPLGLMIIKPHLAIGMAFHVIVTRRWRVVLVAAATVAAALAMSTLAFGWPVWPAFLAGVRDAGSALASGRYPLFRMVSPYAALASLGVPNQLAFAAQGLSAVLALAAIGWTAHRLAIREALGVAAVASLLIPPYAYDYDLPIAGVGMALLLPALIRLGRAGERSLVYALYIVISGFGLAMTARHNLTDGADPPTIAGLLLVVMLALVLNILRRDMAVAGGAPGRN